MRYHIRTPKIRFLTEEGRAITDANRPPELTVLEDGMQISPVTDRLGRVNWEVRYVEEIDPYFTFVYVRNNGYIR